MAINDTINFNSTVDYFKLYNHENVSTSMPTTFATATSRHPSSVTSTTPFTPSTSMTSAPVVNTSSTPSTTIPLVATIPLTISSKIINNYSTSQNDDNSSTSNYKNTSNSYSNSSYFNYTAINSFNQSTLYQYKNLSSNTSSDDNNYNDSAKISYESGSNFMLLLEDFGEYFYNYNGSDYNSSISIYQANCSLTNSSLCSEANARKLTLFCLFLLIGFYMRNEGGLCGWFGKQFQIVRNLKKIEWFNFYLIKNVRDVKLLHVT